jgi:hypothetical protein
VPAGELCSHHAQRNNTMLWRDSLAVHTLSFSPPPPTTAPFHTHNSPFPHSLYLLLISNTPAPVSTSTPATRFLPVPNTALTCLSERE